MFNPIHTKKGLLSETNCSGDSNLANVFQSLVMVFPEVVLDMEKTSGHFEFAWTIMSIIFPLTGPAKST